MLKKIGNTEILEKHKLTCHCGSVELLIDLPDGIVNPSRCNCSICSRKGAVVSAVPLKSIKIIKGQDALSLYQFNTNVAKHYFCSKCGIYTHHQRRSNPEQFSINIACLEGVNPFEIKNVVTGDGINHSCDR
jgi:hypothetical protein